MQRSSAQPAASVARLRVVGRQCVASSPRKMARPAATAASLSMLSRRNDALFGKSWRPGRRGRGGRCPAIKLSPPATQRQQRQQHLLQQDMLQKWSDGAWGAVGGAARGHALEDEQSHLHSALIGLTATPPAIEHAGADRSSSFASGGQRLWHQMQQQKSRDTPEHGWPHGGAAAGSGDDAARLLTSRIKACTKWQELHRLMRRHGAHMNAIHVSALTAHVPRVACPRGAGSSGFCGVREGDAAARSEASAYRRFFGDVCDLLEAR
eukprot:364197-Chlamydomonas_euryale.AAC.47